MNNKYRAYRWITMILSIFCSLYVFTLSLILILQRTMSFYQFGEFVEFITDVYDYSNIPNGLLYYSIGILLLYGIPQLIAGFMIIARKKNGLDLAVIEGFVLMVTGIIFLIVFKYNWVILYSSFIGLLEIIFGSLGVREFYNIKFTFNLLDYNVDNENADTLVIFMGDQYVKKEAYQLASSMNGNVIEFSKDGFIDNVNIKSYRYVYFISYAVNYLKTSPFYELILKSKYRGVTCNAEVISRSRLAYFFEQNKKFKELKHINQITFIHMHFGKEIRRKTERSNKRKK